MTASSPHTEALQRVAAYAAGLPLSAGDQVSAGYGDRLLRHFALYELLWEGRLPSDGAPEPGVNLTQLLEGVLSLQERGASIATLPRQQREARLAETATNMELDEQTLTGIWRWWESCGRKVER